MRLGEYDYSDDADGAPHQDYEVAEAVVYPDYSPPEAYHDLALIRLNSVVKMQVSSRALASSDMTWLSVRIIVRISFILENTIYMFRYQRFIGPVCLPWGHESRVDIAGLKGSVLSFERYISGKYI